MMHNRKLPEKPLEVPAGPVTVLAVSPHTEDHRSLANILAHSNWKLESATTAREAAEFLRTQPLAVVICEYRLPDGGWQEVYRVAEMLNLPCRVIVTSRNADDRMWAEVLNEGGYDCLAKPFYAEEVFRLVSVAWRSSKRDAERSLVRMSNAVSSASAVRASVA